MNTYVYAPKDDVKHRALWRQLYTTEEEGKETCHIICEWANYLIQPYSEIFPLNGDYGSVEY